MKKVITFVLAVSLILLSGCDNKYDEGFSKGYSAGYEAGYSEGYNKAVSDNEEQITEYEDQIADYESQIVKEEPQTYILNKSSKKFHLPTCSAINDMKESNKVERICTRSELIEDGYSPCQQCKP